MCSSHATKMLTHITYNTCVSSSLNRARLCHPAHLMGLMWCLALVLGLSLGRRAVSDWEDIFPEELLFSRAQALLIIFLVLPIPIFPFQSSYPVEGLYSFLVTLNQSMKSAIVWLWTSSEDNTWAYNSTVSSHGPGSAPANEGADLSKGPAFVSLLL